MSEDAQQNEQGTAGKVPYVDPVLCIGCTLCTQICPNTYAMQDDGKSKVVNPTGESEEKIQESIEACPVDAISWKDSN